MSACNAAKLSTAQAVGFCFDFWLSHSYNDMLFLRNNFRY